MRDAPSNRGDRASLAGLRPQAGSKGRIPDARVHIGRGARGIERLEAAFSGCAFAPHRHDTYAIGITLQGVQTFRYRGARRQCLPGQWHILHPDETHDGAAGTDEGFVYRILYLDPALVQEALGGRPLPFVADPVVPRRNLDPSLSTWLADIDLPLGELERIDLSLSFATWLQRLAPVPAGAVTTLRLRALEQVRELIASEPEIQHPLRQLEAMAGMDRWSLARQFRLAFGTSPSRFRTMRQLDVARALMRAGLPLREAALEAGFADQSHLTRMFKRAYGLTPAKWTAALT